MYSQEYCYLEFERIIILKKTVGEDQKKFRIINSFCNQNIIEYMTKNYYI